MDAGQSQAAVQQASDRERDARDAEQRSHQRDQQHERDDGKEQQCEAQQGDDTQGQEHHHESGAECDLRPMPRLQALDCAARPGRKDNQRAEREQDQPRAIAEEGAQGLIGVQGSEAGDRRVEDEPVANPAAVEAQSLRISGRRRSDGDATSDDRLGQRVGPPVAGGDIGQRQEHACHCEDADDDRPAVATAGMSRR